MPLAARGQPTVFMQPMTPCIRPQGIQLSNGSDIPITKKIRSGCYEKSEIAFLLANKGETGKTKPLWA